MIAYFQPVPLPERCLLREALYWIAFQRLPIFETDHEGVDVRESREAGSGYVINLGYDFLEPDECKRANLPVDPRYLALEDGRPTLGASFYDDLLKRVLPEAAPTHVNELEKERDEAVKFDDEYRHWKTLFSQVIEYPASQIFVALKSGQLVARGRMLPTLDVAKARALGEESDIFEINASEIPKEFWTLQGIDFEASAARNKTAHYCHVSMRTDQLLAGFPGERQPIVGAERIGDTIVLTDGTKGRLGETRRGRPPYPWDAFHLEVTALVHSDSLPAKKEAAIQYFQSWFSKELGIRPSRAAIGEKLTPYYEKFVRAVERQKF